jgi:cytochrome c-type biogenesis protein CcmF
MPDHNHDILVAAPWSLATGAAGRIAIFVAIAFFALAFALSFVKNGKATKISTASFVGGCLGLFTSFGALVTLFVTDQFQFQYVFGHSEKANAIQYKVASVWSGQQGSFLLWAVCSALFALFALRGTGIYRRPFVAVCSLFLGALGGILSYESPFILNLFEGRALIPPDGNGLTPALYNYWVVIHPPTIFFGFGSLIILFAYAVSTLVLRDYETWVAQARPWTMVSVTLLGLGLCMGGFWAYEMLGWGGFWMWDPVENASFVPWMFGAALIHGFIVQTTRKKWQFSNVLLAGLPFLWFVYGTFLTRSGFMADVSVHSFATMERTALRLLTGVLAVFSLGFLAFWAFRVLKDRRVEKDEPTGLVRDNFYRVGMIFLCLLGLATAVGMSVPLFQALARPGEEAKVVEEHLYHLVLSWFFVPTMLLMAVAPFVSWRTMSFKEFGNRVLNVLSASLFATGVSLFILNNDQIGVRPDPKATISFPMGLEVPLMAWMGVLIFLCWFTGIANLWRLVEVRKGSKLAMGSFVTHFGLATAMAGLIVSRGFERKQNYVLEPGSTAVGLEVNGPKHMVELVKDQKLNFEDRHNEVALKMMGDGQDFVARPGLYYNFPPNADPQPMVWPYIKRWFSHDIYVVLHPLQTETGQTITLKPGESGEITGPLWANLQEKTYKISYEKMVREGEAGMRGTKFGARVKVESGGQTATVTPKMVVQGEPELAPMDEHFDLKLVRMDAADNSVELGLSYVKPVFPVDTFYKPMTILVWIGVGLMTIGGFMSALYRRPRKGTPIVTEDLLASPEPGKPAEKQENDALISVP